MRSGHDRVEVGGKVAQGGVMSEAVVAEPSEHEGTIGVDLGAGGDDLAGELHLIQAVEHVGQFEPCSAQTATGQALDGDRDRRLLGRPRPACRGCGRPGSCTILHSSRYAGHRFASDQRGPRCELQAQPS
jgi:hypothetical protein